MKILLKTIVVLFILTCISGYAHSEAETALSDEEALELYVTSKYAYLATWYNLMLIEPIPTKGTVQVTYVKRYKSLKACIADRDNALVKEQIKAKYNIQDEVMLICHRHWY